MTTSIGLSRTRTDVTLTASLARQPIVDRTGRLHGYELLFRGAPPPQDPAFDGDRATADVLVTAACDLGWERLGGGHPLFLNVDAGLLLGELIDLAPVEDTVIEIVEHVDVDESVRERLIQLRERGFRIALDDFVPESDAERLLPLVDIVKIDVLQTPAEQWAEVVEARHAAGQLVVAEKVEDAATHELARQAGFDLFQGYLYARPAEQPSVPMSPRHAVCLRLLTALAQDEVDDRLVEDLVTSDPVLTMRTLRMANSAAAGAGREISSVTQAIVLVGYTTLSGWIALMLVADQDAGDPMTSTEVLIRARSCQLVATTRGRVSPAVAFLAGLIPALAEISGLSPLHMLDTVGASEQIRRAVLDGEDDLGELIRDVDRHVSGFDLTSSLDIQMAHLAATVWAHELLLLG